MTIKKIAASYVYDSRGNPTVEVDLTTEKGSFRTIVPSGASTGTNEAVELRDNDKKKWGGKGVLTAVANVNEVIGPALIKANIPITDQKAIDDFLINLDGTPNKAKLGANAILGVSLSCARAAAAEKGLPLYAYVAELAESKQPYVMPVPFENVLNGGKHAGGNLAFQEFMIAPLGFSTFAEALEAGTEVYHALKDLAKKKLGTSAGNVGDEGGIAPNLEKAEDALDLIVEAIKIAGHTGKVKIALDPASSEFYIDGKYDLLFKDPNNDGSRKLSGDELADYYIELIEKYPITNVEDLFAEDDWESWTKFYARIKDKGIQFVADDLTVTNVKYIQRAIDEKCANGLLLKVNQIGTLTESLQAAKMSYDAGWGVMVSHRSGETEDPFIADLTVGLRTGQLKSGAPARSERLAKYNQLLRIERELGGKSVYAGAKYHEGRVL